MLRNLLKVAAQCAFVALFFVGLMARQAHAADDHLPEVAQFDADDTYDPFADYSEFDEAQDEEADINFFRNGRFVTIGFIGGLQGFTSQSAQLFSMGPGFGLYLSYFFDLRFALQFSFLTSDHNVHITSATSGRTATGNINLTDFAMDLKYYINTQNVTKGLAKFNPYFIAGFAHVQRTVSVQDTNGFSKEGCMGFDIGGGIEIPMMRNKMYFGGQALYQLVNFQDKGTEIQFDGGDHTGKFANGDVYTLLGIIGINF